MANNIGGYKIDKELYSCSIEDLEEAIDDLNTEGTKYLLSVSMLDGRRVFSFPTSIEKIKTKQERIISAMENDEVVELSNTWINSKYITCVRISKYIPQELRDEYKNSQE